MESPRNDYQEGDYSRLHHTASGPATIAGPASDNIVPIRTSPQHAELKCCCGRKECAVLEYNNAALEGLERDLDMAARLGRVCILIEPSANFRKLF